MSRDLERIQDMFLEKINHVCREFGLNNIMAQLYASLYFSNKPLSLDDMVERLKISKGSASVNIRVLERYSAVKKIWVKGSRRDYYEAEADIYRVIISRVKSMGERRLAEFADVVNSPYEILNSVNSNSFGEKEEVEMFKQRLNKLRGLYGKAQNLLKLFNSGLLTSLLGGKLTSNKQATKEKDSVYIDSTDKKQ